MSTVLGGFTKTFASGSENSAIMRIAASPVLGGSHTTVRSSNTGGQVHHIPAFKSFNGLVDLTFGKGPAIWMETADHRRTVSCGKSKVADDYRTKQSNLIKQNKFKEAMDLDIADVEALFPGKYTAAINQAVAYYNTIKSITVPKAVTPDNTTPDNSCSI
jgi:hypothetical protein